jgi:hypothetical protein
MAMTPAYWRLLVRHIPGIAVDRLSRDIRSGLFAVDGLDLRARELRAHLSPTIRRRTQLEIMPLLGLEHEGLDRPIRFD